VYDIRRHIAEKGMWAGMIKRVASNSLLGAKAISGGYFAAAKIKTPHSQAFLKSIDELIVNASDHCVACRMKKAPPALAAHSQVTEIDVRFEPGGEISITNNGPGIPVVLHQKVSEQFGRPVYIPEIAFCIPLAGSNLDKRGDNVKGGTNGLGCKIANISSRWFEVTTVSFGPDGSRRLYRQLSEDRMQVVHPPTVVDLAAEPCPPGWDRPPTPHTRVRLLPAYDVLGYRPGTPAWQADYADIGTWFQLRLFQLATYLGPAVQVRFNERPVAVVAPQALAGVYLLGAPRITPASLPEVQTFAAQIKPRAAAYKQHPWNVFVAVAPQLRQFGHVTIINGVVSIAGPHIGRFKAAVQDEVSKKLHRLVKDSGAKYTIEECCKHLFFIVTGTLPGADWTGQRKDEIAITEEALQEYAYPKAWLREIADAVVARVVEGLAHTAKPTKGAKISDEAKYTPAAAAPKNRKGLLVAEGDSAIQFLRKGLTLGDKNPGGPSFELYGIMSLKGVPINALKMTTELGGTAGADGAPQTQIARKKKLDDNVILKSLIQVLGLEHGRAYDTPAERARLNYREVILCVDQDLDGVGKICGIFLSNFARFWPGLLRAGYVRWFMTPVIRVYPRAANTIRKRIKQGPLQEFFHEDEYVAWAAGAGGTDAVGKKFNVCYYKGLGGHNDAETLSMFKDFEKKLYTFYYDGDAPRLFKIYFGEDSLERKRELIAPSPVVTAEFLRHLEASRTIPCSFHLRHYAKPFKLDAIQRQLPSIDGLTEGRRKGAAGARKRWKGKSGVCKTYQLTGYVASEMAYHHGDSSMNNTLTTMCQTFPGARTVPLFEGTGAGSWVKGGQDSASPRYTDIGPNEAVVSRVFPPVDDWCLPHRFIDGARAEPSTYVPVLPLAALDNWNNPSEGWAINTWGRRISQTAEIVRAFCDARHPHHAVARDAVESVAAAAASAFPPEWAGEEAPALLPPAEVAERRLRFRAAFPLDPAIRNLHATFRLYDGKLHHFGLYQVNGLPLAPPAPGSPGVPAGAGAGRTCVPTGLGGVAAHCAATGASLDAWLARADAAGLTLRVLQLPFRTWADPFVKRLTGTRKSGEPTAQSVHVEYVNNYSGDDRCDIQIKLKPGAYAALLKAHQKNQKKAELDPLELFFGKDFHASTVGNINVLKPFAGAAEGGVLEFGNDYHLLVLYCLPFRQRLYALRLQREATILQLRIRLERETIRYIDHSSEIAIQKTKDVREAAAKLAAARFPRFQLATVNQPGFASLPTLRACLIEADAPAPAAGPADVENVEGDRDGEGTEDGEGDEDGEGAEGGAAAATAGRPPSYDYILNLRSRDLLQSSRRRHAERLARLEADAARVQAALDDPVFPGAQVWLQELEELVGVLQEQGFYT